MTSAVFFFTPKKEAAGQYIPLPHTPSLLLHLSLNQYYIVDYIVDYGLVYGLD